MGKVLCAIRGGEEGYRTQEAAAALAAERGDELIFLMVLETGFFQGMGPGGADMHGTLTRMGNSILFHAAERARHLGVEAHGVLREGSPREQIRDVVQEEGATVVVLGRPQGRYDKFSLDSLETFAAEIAEATGTEVKIL